LGLTDPLGTGSGPSSEVFLESIQSGKEAGRQTPEFRKRNVCA
jgi:hypothetical protein